MTQPNTDSIRDRIGKLFNQADNVKGTPEAEAFEAKAFELLAKYGISESEARGTLREGSNVVEHLTFELKGSYLQQQNVLLHQIVRALHCEDVYTDFGRTMKRVDVYGVKLHTDRVRLLFAILNPRMVAAGSKVVKPWHSSVSTRAYRVSWMISYATTIGDRLAEAERNAAATADAKAGNNTQALVLVSDADRAVAAYKAAHPSTRDGGYRSRHDADAAMRGAAEARRADLGQTRVGGRQAIGR